LFAAYVPPQQFKQTLARVAPAKAEYLPLPQSVHSASEPTPWPDQLPAGHSEHCQNTRFQPE